jgi:hypothetical protein
VDSALKGATQPTDDEYPKAVIDARLIVNQEPADEEIEPGITTSEEFFAWSLREGSDKARGE